MVGRRRDWRRRKPGSAAVERPDLREPRLVEVRDHDGAVRTGYRLHPVREGARDCGTTREAGGVRRRGPGQAAVRGGLRLDLGSAEIVVAEIAVAEEGARRPVVAGDPLLVEQEARAPSGGHGLAPVQAVGGSAHEQGRVGAAEGQRDGQPDAVPGVVGNGRVAHSRPRPGRPGERGQPGQEATLPGAAAVSRGREAGVGGPAVCDAADLEDGDDRRAPGVGVRLDL